jgi:hypothetical protein
MFCIHPWGLEIASAGQSNGSIQSPTISQNAGCTMALLANCTKVKIHENLKMLFLKGILLLEMLAQSLQLSVHACH